MINFPHPNTPRGVGADGNAIVPSAYSIKKFLCKNSAGAEFDITQLVTSFTITEELFSPVIVLNINIRDNINFFEDFALSGEETIFLDIEREAERERGGTSLIRLEFAVKEYPNYQKLADEPNVQEYNIVAVSPFAYSSMLNRISRSVKGNPLDAISKILKDDLSQKIDLKSPCVTSFDGIITIQSPLKAVEWLKGKCFDSSGSPFFIFSTISSDRISIQSLADMWSSRNGVFRKYQYRQFIQNKTGTPEFYDENRTRILDMKSNIKLDKLTQAMKGGFSSTTRINDLANKTYLERIFDYTKDEVVSKTRLDLKSLFSDSRGISFGLLSGGLKSINSFVSSSISNIFTNSTANDGNPNSTSGPIADNIARAKSYYANMDAVTHTIIVYGDFNLNPGKKIYIEVPKAIDIAAYEKAKKSTTEKIDKALSGNYIVAVVAHTFKEGMYTAKVQIIKDA
jgi:hypothetical protein